MVFAPSTRCACAIANLPTPSVAIGKGHFADIDPVDTHPDAMLDIGDALQRHFDFGLRRRRRGHVRQIDDLLGRLARHDQRTEEVLLVAVDQRPEEDGARLQLDAEGEGRRPDVTG